MAKKDEKNLNITIKNQDDNKDTMVISLSSIFKHLKKYFAVWLAVAIIGGVVATAYSGFKTMVAKPSITALVSFTYKGIEKGLDPAGRTFDANSLKSPTVIEGALTSLDIDIDNLDSIRKNISIEGIIPEDAINRITAYKNIYETANTGNLAAAQAMLDVAFYPTTYKVHFNYGETGLSRSESAQVLNAMLQEYRGYFYKQYGFNQSLGTAVPAVDYTNYDYAEQIDIFDDTLTTLEKYLKNLASDDTNLFRSNQTGFSFNDLYRAAQTIESIDLDRISSLITVNNITKDKNASISYCNYRIENLERTSSSLKERLNTIEDSISKYEKDTILIFGNGTDGNDTSYSQASEEYDNLINQRVSTSTELADTKQKIEFYKSRKNALSSNKTASKEMKENVEEQLADLGVKIKDLVNTTELTAQEYYENVEFQNAYNILVPAEASAVSSISTIIHNAIMPVVLAEALILIVYFAVSFIMALIHSNKKTAFADGDDDDDDDDDDDADLEDVIEEIEEAAESVKESKKKKK